MPHLTFPDHKSVYYQIEGKGPCVIFLHGFMESSQMWNRIVSDFSKTHKTLIIDLPGHGKSSGFSETHQMSFMAALVLQITSKEKIDNFSIIGHSMGGYVAMEMLRQAEERTNAVCLLHSHAAADSIEAKVNRDRTVEIIKKGASKFITSFIPDLFAPENISNCNLHIKESIIEAKKMKDESIIAAIKGMKERECSLDLIANTNCPIQFIIGKKDKRVHLQTMLLQISLPKQSQSLVLDSIGHMGHFEATEIILKVIKSFINQTN